MRKKNKIQRKKDKKVRIKFLNKPMWLESKTPFYRLFSSFYGVHLTSSFQMSSRFGCLPYFLLSHRDIWKKVEVFFDSFYYVGRPFEKEKKSAIADLKKIGSYRGIRFLQGLPVRGQRTHSNACTMKRLFRKGEKWSKVEKVKKRY